MNFLTQPTDIINTILSYVEIIDAASLCLRYTCKFFHDRIPKQRYKPSDSTASYSLEVFKLLVPVCKKDRAMLYAASFYGNLPVIRYLVEERKHYFTEAIISAAAQHIDCITYYLKHCKVTNAITLSCFDAGCLETLKYCVDRGGKVVLDSYYHGGNTDNDISFLECLKYCIGKGMNIDHPGVLIHCQRMILIESMKFMLDRVSSALNVQKFIRRLIELNENDLLKILLSHCRLDNIEYISHATYCDNIEAVKLLHQYGGIPTSFVFSLAFYTSFDCLKYFHENDVEWDVGIMEIAWCATNPNHYKQLHVDYMRERGYELDLSHDLPIR